MSTTITRDEVFDKVRRLAASQVAITPAEVAEQSHFFNDLGFDSLDMVDFVMNLEEEFGIAIEDEQAEQVKTVGQALDALMPLLLQAARQV